MCENCKYTSLKNENYACIPLSLVCLLCVMYERYNHRLMLWRLRQWVCCNESVYIICQHKQKLILSFIYVFLQFFYILWPLDLIISVMFEMHMGTPPTFEPVSNYVWYKVTTSHCLFYSYVKVMLKHLYCYTLCLIMMLGNTATKI